MRHLIATKRSSQAGFTMLELLVVTMMIGVMAAIASPGMLGFIRRGKVTSAHSAVQGALQEMQREAIKRGTNCNVTFPASNTSGSLTITSNCLISGTVTLEDVRIRHDLPNITLDLFNFRGETEDALTGDVVIIISQQDGNLFQKCIALSDGLGLIRIGNYPDGNTTTNISQCSPTS